VIKDKFLGKQLTTGNILGQH